MLRAGLPIEGELLALAAASHSGEDFHVQGVHDILDYAGLTADDLRCPPSLPLDEATARRLIRESAPADPARSRGCGTTARASTRRCWSPASPTTGRPRPTCRPSTRCRCTSGGPSRNWPASRSRRSGVDGCGAPLFALTLGGLARAFRALVLAEPGSPERKVADAMRKFPEWTSGTTRDENKLMTAIPGLLLKAGAEGVDAFALPDGTAAAVKIDDGNASAPAPRSRSPSWPCSARSRPSSSPPPTVTGGGAPVGVIRATRLV